MKKLVALLAIVLLGAGIATAGDIVYQGSFTNTTLTITNAYGRLYIVSAWCSVYGPASGSYNAGSTILLYQTLTSRQKTLATVAATGTGTNQISYTDTGATVPWEAYGILQFNVGASAATVTSEYFIVTTDVRK